MDIPTGQAQILTAWRAWIVALKASKGAPTPAARAAEQTFIDTLCNVQDNVTGVTRDVAAPDGTSGYDNRPPRPGTQSWLPVFTLP
jgi:hypothetical protein